MRRVVFACICGWLISLAVAEPPPTLPPATTILTVVQSLHEGKALPALPPRYQTVLALLLAGYDGAVRQGKEEEFLHHVASWIQHQADVLEQQRQGQQH